jgi:hypothetical protein
MWGSQHQLCLPAYWHQGQLGDRFLSLMVRVCDVIEKVSAVVRIGYCEESTEQGPR